MVESDPADASDSALDTLWKHVLDHWGEDRAHAAFLDACQRSDRLVEAAVRYRGMAADRERGPVAQKHLSAVTALALAKLEATRTVERPRRQYGAIALIVFFVLATLVLLAYERGWF